MTLSIQANKRTEGNVMALRQSGALPGIMYGAGAAPEPLQVQAVQFSKLYSTAGGSTLVDLVLNETEPIKVLIQDVQHDPVRGNITHVDFLRIDMSKAMHAVVELRFVGESAAVKEQGGTLVKTAGEVHVTCLPKDLVHSIDVDLAFLKTFDDVIHVHNLILPNGITIADASDMVVAKVTPPLTEEELKAMEEAVAPVDLTKIEVEEKGKKPEEGEEAAAGEAAPAKKEPAKKE